jgi:hypothetical protein
MVRAGLKEKEEENNERKSRKRDDRDYVFNYEEP